MCRQIVPELRGQVSLKVYDVVAYRCDSGSRELIDGLIGVSTASYIPKSTAPNDVQIVVVGFLPHEEEKLCAWIP